METGGEGLRRNRTQEVRVRLAPIASMSKEQRNSLQTDSSCYSDRLLRKASLLEPRAWRSRREKLPRVGTDLALARRHDRERSVEVAVAVVHEVRRCDEPE